MSTSNEQVKAGDDGWLSTAIPIVITVVISVITTFSFLKLYGGTTAEPPVQSPQGIVVFELSDWIKGISSTASPDEIERQLMKGREAADRAAESGYVVLEAAQVIAYPDAMRLTPHSPFVTAGGE
jgi:hypothetical protein